MGRMNWTWVRNMGLELEDETKHQGPGKCENDTKGKTELGQDRHRDTAHIMPCSLTLVALR